MILSLDAHAHVEPDIDPRQLVALNACVFAVTRNIEEFKSTMTRDDASVVWGAGCHPGLAGALNRFDAAEMIDAIGSTPLIGEVGLDGSARTPMDKQVSVLRQIFQIACDHPRLLSVHSYRATHLVLEEVRRCRPTGIILHWWLGDDEETAEALDLGALFSVNASQAKKWKGLALVPAERLLLETDHPFGDRAEGPSRRPGHLARPEALVSSVLGISDRDLRRQVWRNLGRVAEEMDLVHMFPTKFQVQLLAA